MDYSRSWKSASPQSPLFRHLNRTSFGGPRDPRNRFRALLAALSRAGILVWRRFLKVRGFWKKLLLVGIFLGLLGFTFFGLTFAYYSFSLPDPNKLLDVRQLAESTKILDRNGKLLYEVHGDAKRTLVQLEQIPVYTKNAAIAIEDKNFYKHRGISLAGIARAAIVNILSASRAQGGSTITQQFVRNAVLTREKTFARKIKEIALSLQLERRYSKDEILQLYFNEIPYGSTIYGVEAASQTFFGKSVADLTLAESAYLAAIPQAPTYYSPYGPRRDELDARADTVLQLMFEQGYVTEQERNQAQGQQVEFRVIGRGILAPHFVLYVQDLLAQKYGEISLRESGFKVTTSLDLDLQTIAEEAVANQGAINAERYRASNAALVAIDPKTGHILAMVGSRDYFNQEIDGAVNVTLRPRQPGSSFKPYVYAAAFKKGMSPATMLFDVVTNFGEFGGREYVPQNYDGLQRGPVSVRTALQGSLNIPAVKTILLTGVEDAIDTAATLGITTLQDRSRFGPSAVLGGAEVKLLEHTAAYGVFANAGVKQDPVAILKVEDNKGRILEEHRSSRGQEVLHPQIVYQINHVLSDNESRIFIFGRNNRLTLPGRPVAAKTGTTQENRDNWIVGYTPSLVAGVWVGNNNNDPMTERAFGSSTTAPIWQEFMRRALEGRPAEDFPRPEGIVEIAVDALSGKLPTSETPSTKIEIFASNFNLPTEQDDVHLNGQTFLRSEKPDDPAWENPARDWALAHGYAWAPIGGNGGPLDSAVNVQLSAPREVKTLPWRVEVQAEPSTDVRGIELFLDNYFLAEASGATLEYVGNELRVDGPHQLAAVIRTTAGATAQKSATVNFELGTGLVLIAPKNNQTLNFPANLVLEAAANVSAESVKFFLRDAAGNPIPIVGPVTKQVIGRIVHYTLNWSEANKPFPGSYAMVGQIGENLSNEPVIKIP